ncbi:N-acetyltransferase [Streptomyces seoulensis]|uniref:N-acetyltransferase n=1 Tax=Streptomyces seoulensis TaxID=73044 RepID=A0A4P6TQY8_STRSO|nr:N-acetyltransferase [Streptomyces seoulensis]
MTAEGVAVISAHGLLLREWTPEDLPVLRALFDDPDVAYRTPLAAPFDAAAARAYLDSAIGAHRRLHLAITTDGRTALGEILLDRDLGGIGYVVGAAHRGRGLAARALRAMTEHAHRAEGMDRVLLEIEPDNAASVAVARSAGYRRAAVAAETVTDKGRTYELLTWEHLAPAG